MKKKKLSEVSLRRAFSILMVISSPHLETFECSFPISFKYHLFAQNLSPPQKKPKRSVSGRRKVHYFSTAEDNKRFDRLWLLCLLNFHHQMMFDTLPPFPPKKLRSSIREQRKYLFRKFRMLFQKRNSFELTHLEVCFLSYNSGRGKKKSMVTAKLFRGGVSSQLVKRHKLSSLPLFASAN